MSARRKTNGLTEAPWIGADLQDYVSSWYEDKIEWRPNEPFEATLALAGTSRGRSAARFDWINVADGGRMVMFMTDVADLINYAEIVTGEVTATWQVVKRGQNYGIALAIEVTS